MGMQLKSLENEIEYNHCKEYIIQLEQFRDESPKFVNMQSLIDRFKEYVKEWEDNNIEIE